MELFNDESGCKVADMLHTIKSGSGIGKSTYQKAVDFDLDPAGLIGLEEEEQS